MEVIVGTYEEFLLGYQLKHIKDGKAYLEASFTNHSHTGGLRCVAVCGKFLVSGGTDEIIRVFNLSKRNEVGMILEHEGTITDLEFHAPNHLFSCAEDGNICIFRRGKWQCEKTLIAHKGGVTNLAVHPSGKLAISVGKDKKLMTWNLITGRKAFVTNLKAVSDRVYWAPDGSRYLVCIESRLDIYEVDSGMMTLSVDVKQRINVVAFLSETIIAIGGEGHNICVYNITEGKELVQWEAHTNRVKALCAVSTKQGLVYLFSASSDGQIRVWKITLSDITVPPSMLTEVNTSCRIICMAIYAPEEADHLESHSDNTNIVQNVEDISEVDESTSSKQNDISTKLAKSKKRKTKNVQEVPFESSSIHNVKKKKS